MESDMHNAEIKYVRSLSPLLRCTRSHEMVSDEGCDDEEGVVRDGGRRNRGAPSYLAFDVHLAKSRLFGEFENIASFARQNSDVAVLRLHQRVAAVGGNKVETFSLNVFIEKFRVATCKRKLFGEEFAAYIGFIAVEQSVKQRAKGFGSLTICKWQPLHPCAPVR